jgi:hypothetical protein
MPKKPNAFTDTQLDYSGFARDGGDAIYGLVHARGLDLRPELPLTTHELVGIDLTHRIDTSDLPYAKGGPGGGGGGGGGGGTTFAPYTSGPATAASGYNITIEFKGTWTQDLYNIFVQAADKLTALIVGEIPNVTVYGLKGGPQTIDDIKITAELGNIDGLYGILGQAGPTSVRTSSSLPATAQMKFDIVDVNAMGLAVFSEVVLHEMSHSLGFGSIWDRLGLVSNGEFTGSHAVAEFHDMGGTGNIPVEQDGGSGTAGSHWDEETFHNELMTGYIDDGENYFTEMSAAQFADLGYVINPTYGPVVDPGYIFV